MSKFHIPEFATSSKNYTYVGRNYISYLQLL